MYSFISANTALECSLALHGPFSNGSVIAEFDCNRPTSATCTIGSLPSQTCKSNENFLNILRDY